MSKQRNTDKVLWGAVGRKKKFCDLAYATFQAFEKYVNVEDCGIKYAPGKTCHIITKEERALMARYRAGERGLVRSNDYPFEPRQFHRDVLAVRQVHEQIVEGRVHYYTSNPKAFGLAYLDVDAHYAFQTDARKALDLLLGLFGPDVLFARDSDRGQNGYAKVWHGGRIDLFNDTLKELQRLLHLLFRQNHVLCDIEIKGTITTPKKCGSLAKLPFSTFAPDKGRQSWDAEMLEEFKAKPDIDLDSLVRFVGKLRSCIDVAKTEDFDRHVRRLKEQEKGVEKNVEYESLEDAISALYFERYVAETQRGQPGTANQTPPPEFTPAKPEEAKALNPQEPCCEAFAGVEFGDVDEADSFHRQFWALLPLHRSLRRVASLAEALAFIKAKNLYTGDWSENCTRREARISWMLKHQAQTFDASKCGTGHVAVGKFDGWAKANFTQPITRSKKSFDGEKVKKIATWQDVATYLAVFEFCLETSSKGDKGVPHERVMNLWESLYEKGLVPRQAKDKKVKVIRQTLEARDVIRITDRNYRRGKSMTYEFGPNYPSKEFWRKPKKQREQQAPRFAEKGHPRSAVAPLPGPRVAALFPANTQVRVRKTSRCNNTQKILNTVPTVVGAPNGCRGVIHPSTGPPSDLWCPERLPCSPKTSPASIEAGRRYALSLRKDMLCADFEEFAPPSPIDVDDEKQSRRPRPRERSDRRTGASLPREAGSLRGFFPKRHAPQPDHVFGVKEVAP